MPEVDRADFHVHVGPRTNEDFLSEAIENNVKIVVALDRGSDIRTARLRSLIAAGAEKDILVIPGVESFIKTPINGQEVGFELIGVNFDLDHPDIYRVFDPEAGIPPEFHDPKVAFQRSILEKHGFDMSTNPLNEVLYQEIGSRRIGATAGKFCEIALTNPTNLEMLKSTKWEGKINEHYRKRDEDRGNLANVLYHEFFADGKVGFWPGYMNLRLVVDTIHKAGGVVVGAHPRFEWSEGQREVTLDDLIDFWFDQGVDGLEGWDAGPLDLELAQKAFSRNRLILGGSGRDVKYQNRIMGKGDIIRQDMYIPLEVYGELIRYQVLPATPSLV